jgi:hypothetical protein
MRGLIPLRRSRIVRIAAKQLSRECQIRPRAGHEPLKTAHQPEVVKMIESLTLPPLKREVGIQGAQTAPVAADGN